MKLAENLHLLRKQKGLTQEEIANQFGVTSQSVSKWELGLSCPDILLLPVIAKFYQISVDELLGCETTTSINSIYIQIKELLQDSKNPIDDVYRIARLSNNLLDSHESNESKKLLEGKTANNLSYGQGNAGIRINSDNAVFVCSFNDLRKYNISTIRKVSKYLNKLSDLNTLKVLFALFELSVENSIIESYTLDQIKEKTNMDVDSINKAFNNLDIYFDQQEYEKTGVEKYSLEHLDQVPLLITLLVPSLYNYNYSLLD